MPGQQKLSPEQIEEVWRTYLTTGEVPSYISVPWYRAKRLRGIYGHLPDDPRCRLCMFPFEGLGGTLVRRFFGVVPSKLNPQVCNQCEEFAEQYQGGAEVELSILFADVRGSTTLAESMSPTEFSRLINRFYNAATKVLFDSGAMVEKLIGDAVTGFFTPGQPGPDHARIAVRTAQSILRATGHNRPSGPWIPVGIGIHTGTAYVGAISSDSGVTDIAVLGDAANIGARLAAQAAVGEIHISQATAEAAGLDSAGFKIRQQEIRGRSEPIEVWVLNTHS
ncbi:MAG: adenylate/guanylate cyclase domain-containing protein [Chloroflexi bacterium]|nr:adenylate/guanylate cyclase domain-containing protein [Chloroflexota bacterium]